MVKIKRIRIKNFRSIVEADIPTEDITIFVGLNDVGKSNVLKALDLFFNYKSEFFSFFENYSNTVDLKGHRAKEIVITLTIEIPDGYRDKGEIEWTKKWLWTKTRGVEFQQEFNKEFTARARTQVLLDRITYNYIPAVKSKNYFRKLLSLLYESMLTSANSELKEVNDVYSSKLMELTSDLSANIKEHLNLESRIRMPEDLSSLFSDLFFETEEEQGKPISLYSRGDGIQARHIPAILKFIFERKYNDAQKRSVPCTIIWGYEEPENGIELAACFELANELYDYSQEIQLFITSHSPAFYSLQNKDRVCVYLTKKTDCRTKYLTSHDNVELDKHFGLLPVIQPYIDEEIQKRKQIETKLTELEVKIKEAEKRSIIIVTEGKTDTLILRTAFSRIKDIDSDIISRIQFFDFNKKGTLGSELSTLLDNIAATPIDNIVIGIFDRDKPVNCLRGKSYYALSNRVFKFNIPSLDINGLSDGDEITIENYFSENQIKVEMDSGRLYMGNDFNKYGTSSDGNWSIDNYQRNKIPAYRVIDREFRRISPKSDSAKMATKSEFATYVSTHPEAFSFDSFVRIYNVIIQILDDCK